MNSKILEYVIAAAEEGSVGKAADRFYLSRQALMHHIDAIESDLGAPIFQRTREGLELTPAGIIYINDAKAILRVQEDMESRIRDIARQERTAIRIAVDSTMYNATIRSVLPAFREQYPECQVQLTKCNAVTARKLITSGVVELAAYMALTPWQEDLETMMVQAQEVCPVYPPGYDLPLTADGIPAAVAAGLLPVLHPVGTTMRAVEERCLTEQRVYAADFLEGNYADIINYITEGSAFGILPRDLCEIVRDRNVVVGDPLTRLYDLLVYPANRPVGAELQALMHCMMQAYGSKVYYDSFRYLSQSAPAGQ